MSKINVRKLILVCQRHGPDTLILETDLPSGIWPFHGTQNLRTEIARGTAVQWVEENFPETEFEIVEG